MSHSIGIRREDFPEVPSHPDDLENHWTQKIDRTIYALVALYIVSSITTLILSYSGIKIEKPENIIAYPGLGVCGAALLLTFLKAYCLNKEKAKNEVEKSIQNIEGQKTPGAVVTIDGKTYFAEARKDDPSKREFSGYTKWQVLEDGKLRDIRPNPGILSCFSRKKTEQ